MVCKLIFYCYWERLIEYYLMKDRRQNNAEKLLSEIIEFNRNRILCRLRSSHSGKTKTKRSIINILAEALEKLQACNIISTEILESLKQIIHDMVAVFSKLEAMKRSQARSFEADKFLLSILRNSNCLFTEYKLKDILSTIPHGDSSFQKERKISLVEGVRKLGHYIKLGPVLLRFARRFAIFRNITVRCIRIRSTAPGDLHGSTQKQMPQSLLRQYLQDPSSVRGQKIAQLAHRTTSNLVDTQAELQQKSLCKKRIHAEIQLLFYYEQQPQIALRPRVICSSKNACFLCNAFMRLHNRFYTPKTHGKLYPLWTLPEISTLSLARSRIGELGKLYRQFNILIEEKIISCLETKRLVHIYDNESKILNIRSLTASEVTAAEEVMSKLVPNSAGSLLIHQSPNSGTNVTEIFQSDIGSEGLLKGSSKPLTPQNLNAAGEKATENLVSNDAKSLFLDPSHKSSTTCTDTLQSIIENGGTGKGSSKTSIARHPDTIHRSSLSHSVNSSSTTQNLNDIATPPIKANEMDLLELTPHTAIPKIPEPKSLLRGQAVWSVISLSSPPTRFHTSHIHVELSFDQASSLASLNSLANQESNLPGEAGSGMKVCALWLTAAEAEKVRGAPGEINLADDWTCKRIDGVLYSPDGLVLRKGGEVLKLSVEKMVV